MLFIFVPVLLRMCFGHTTGRPDQVRITFGVTPANWSDGVVPTIANTDYATYQLNGELLRIACYAETKGFVTGGWGASDPTELLSGGYFYVDNVFLGEATPETTNPCVFTNNGGDFVLTTNLFVGGSGGTGNGSYVQNAGYTVLYGKSYLIWEMSVDKSFGILLSFFAHCYEDHFIDGLFANPVDYPV